MGIFSGIFTILAVVNTVVVGLFGLFAGIIFRLAVNTTVEGEIFAVLDFSIAGIDPDDIGGGFGVGEGI